MSSLLVKVVAFLFVMDSFEFYIDASKAIRLLSVDKKSGKFILNHDALSLLKQLPSRSIKVVSAIGDARVGKSTALNYLAHSLNGFTSEQKVGEVFETGDTMEPVTHGVWLSLEPKQGFVLLDVEGTDLGNDEQTTKLSIFTALMSSSLMIFMKEAPSNHILQFLYKICRVSENVVKEEDMKYFPLLLPVMRGNLKVPKGFSSTADYIKDVFTNIDTQEQEGVAVQRTIGKYFPKETIKVFELPYVENISKNFASEYFYQIRMIYRNLLNASPDKKTPNGGQMDGKGLASLAKLLVDEMNNNKDWQMHLTSVIILFEKENCRNGFDKYISPLLDVRLNLKEIKGKREGQMENFKKVCKLEEMRGAAEEKIRFALELAEKRKSESSSFYDYAKYVACLVGGVVIANSWQVLLSDARLKQNIKPVNESEYAVIGLQGVQWVWNEQAEKLGLSGIAEGVVAQDVEKVYPWAVVQGLDGYKRVNYLALKIMIKFNSFTM